MRSEGWIPTTLGAEADLLTGFPFKSSMYSDFPGDVKLLRGDNIVQGSLRWDGVKRWPRGLANDFARYQLQPGDVVLAMDRPWIEAGLKFAALAEGDLPALLVQRVARLRGNEELDTRFLRYLIGSASFTHHILAVQTGTAVPHISGEQIRSFQFLRPPLSKQKAIAEILGSLDDKIDLNRRMNETLEAIARAIFKSWFLEFSTGRRSQGWRHGRLGEVADNPRRGVDPTEVPPSTPYIGLEHMPRKCIALDQWGSSEDLASGKFSFSRGEILFGKLRPYFHKVGVAPVEGVCSTDILVVVPKRDIYFGLLLGHVSSEEFVAYTDRSSAGTKMPRTNWADMARYEITIPPDTVALEYTALVQPMVDKIMTNVHESRTLTVLRDTLLPKLLSGEIRVKQAERLVGEAV